MADVEVTCPHCKQSFDCSEKVGGKNIECLRGQLYYLQII